MKNQIVQNLINEQESSEVVNLIKELENVKLTDDDKVCLKDWLTYDNIPFIYLRRKLGNRLFNNFIERVYG